MSEMNIAELFENNEALQPIVDLIDAVLNLSDGDLNDNTIEIVVHQIDEVLNAQLKQLSINNLLESFATQNLSPVAAKELVEQTKESTKEYITARNPSNNQQKILNDIMNIFFELFDQALDQYDGYSFTLPIQLDENAKIPIYAHKTDAAADIYANKILELAPHSLSNKVPTGLRIALPEGWAAAILPRSSIGAKTGLRLSNSVGIIDSDYRGEIGILYDNISDAPYTINEGDRIAQMIIFPVYHFKVQQVKQVNTTERGEGGFGSSGK